MVQQFVLELITGVGNALLSVFRQKLGLSRMIKMSMVILSYFRYDPMTTDAYVKVTNTLNEEYDFIVIGAGTAGSVVAGRLSEVNHWKTLLLEAGENENELIQFPAMFSFSIGSDLDWQYKTTPSKGKPKFCLAMKGNRCNIPRGKILGGTSSINSMVYIRGNKYDFDRWESLGNPGWSYEDVLPYFLKSEDNRNKNYLKTRYHKSGGLLTIDEAPYRSGIAKYFIEAGKELGYEKRDINGEIQTGFMISQATIRNGSRCSTARAFLRTARYRRNLHISIRSQVTKILIDPNTKTAYGVEFLKNGVKRTIRARKEVILSAGAITSPQILMLSGVGIKKHLEQHDIPVIQDLRVGDNLQDHYGLGGLQFIIDAPLSLNPTRLLDVKNVIDYITKMTGPLASVSGECVAFINTQHANKSIDWPDMQFDYGPYSLNTDREQLMNIMNLREDFYDKALKPLGSRDAFVIVPNIMRPKSRGHIRLNSSNPHVHPIINPNYFSHPGDVKVLIDGIRIALDFVQQKSFRKLNARFYNYTMPGCGHLLFDTDEYWECALRQFTMTIWHFSGTCKMGPKEDPTAVVDHRLQVHGVKNLRVVDASIMPEITTGNIMAPVIMIGEKAADVVKQRWN